MKLLQFSRASEANRFERHFHGKTMRYVAFDVETTGLNPRRGDRIIEVGAVAIEKGTMGDEFHRLIDIEKPISEKASRLHGITAEMLSGQPQAEEVLNVFRQFIGKGVLVAHNTDFDVGLLGYEYGRIGQGLPNRHICTLKLSRKIYPSLPDYRLETVAKHILGVEFNKGRFHRALDDARLTARIWVVMRKKR
jgi:DNA polymerase-3 subunit epsilon